MTLIELLVVIAIIAVLVSFIFSRGHHGGPMVRGQLIQAVSYARQIHVATMAMATDGVTNEDLSLGWPGDLKARGRINTASDFVNTLARNDYFKPGDLRVFSATGIKAYPGGTLSSGSNAVLSPAFTEENNAFKILSNQEG